MKRGTQSKPYGACVMRDLRAKLTPTQHDYLRARALLDNTDIQDVVRRLIDQVYEKEKRNDIDVIELAKENGLL